MARPDRKTVRFTQVVEHSGEPRVHTLWLPPAQDAELQRAQKAHRVMTVQPAAPGGKADVGEVGLNARAGKPAQVLVFPKSLKRFEGARIVGIKFELVAHPKLDAVDPLAYSGPPKSKHPARTPAAPTLPVRKQTPAARSSRTITVTPRETEPPQENVVPFAAAPEKPEPQKETRTKPPRKNAQPPRAAGTAPPQAATATRLIREIRAAMKELERGKAVAAYQRLERAVSEKT